MPNAQDWLTSLLALWGAVIATAALVWNIARDVFMQRPKIKLSARVMVAFGGGGPLKDGESYLIVTVVNISRRPVKLVSFGLVTWSGHDLLVRTLDTLPVTLSDGDSLDLFGEADGLKTSLESLGRIRYIGVWDSTSKVWKVPRRNTRKVISEIENRKAK